MRQAEYSPCVISALASSFPAFIKSNNIGIVCELTKAMEIAAPKISLASPSSQVIFKHTRRPRPKLLNMQVHLTPMHAHIRNVPSNPHQLLTHQKRLRHPHSLDHNIKPIFIRKPPLRRLPCLRGRINFITLRCANLLRDFKPILIPVKENDTAGTVQTSSDAGGKTYRARSDDGDGAAGFHEAAEDADFKARGQDVGVDEEGALISALRDGVEAAVGVGHADVFGLGAVFGVAELPAAVFAGVVQTTSVRPAQQNDETESSKHATGRRRKEH